MKLTDEQLDRISEIMDEVEIMTPQGERSWIRALAAGMRELAKMYEAEKANITDGPYAEIDWIDLTEMRQTLEQAADDLEAK